jgi:hypothetical protein
MLWYIQQAGAFTRAGGFLRNQAFGQVEIKIFGTVAHGPMGLRNRQRLRQRADGWKTEPCEH